MPNKNTLALIATGILTLSFFVAGLLNVLDYFIVKALLFLGLGVWVTYVCIVVLKSSENQSSSSKEKTTPSDQT